MSGRATTEKPPAPAGLCDRCRFARLVRGRRSSFLLCERSRDDPRFDRYPRLPVLACPGFEPGPLPNPQSGGIP